VEFGRDSVSHRLFQSVDDPFHVTALFLSKNNQNNEHFLDLVCNKHQERKRRPKKKKKAGCFDPIFFLSCCSVAPMIVSIYQRAFFA
jgi:hypothetical protein